MAVLMGVVNEVVVVGVVAVAVVSVAVVVVGVVAAVVVVAVCALRHNGLVARASVFAQTGVGGLSACVTCGMLCVHVTCAMLICNPVRR